MINILTPTEKPTIPQIEEHFGAIFEEPSSEDNNPIIDEFPQPISFISLVRKDVYYKTQLEKSCSRTRQCDIWTGNENNQQETCVTILYIITEKNGNPTVQNGTYHPSYEKDNRQDPTNWKPITIPPTLQHLFHKIIAERVTAFTMNVNQRGFQRYDGTMGDVFILESFLKTRLQPNKSYTVASIALLCIRLFETISHGSIERALVRIGIDANTINFITTSLSNSTTIIRIQGGSTRPIKVKRGVK